MLVGYILYSYATATGFKYSVVALNSATIPFINVSHDVASWLALIAWIAGLTSTLGVLISAVNSQARLIFNAGREGLLPRWIGRVQPGRQTPRNAIFLFTGIGGLIIVVWCLLHLIGGAKHGDMSPYTFFDDSGTMGTLLVLVVYFLANLALPFYYWRYRRPEFSVIKHAVLPALGLVAVGVPVYYLVKPGQSAPLNWFPYAALAIIVVSLVYSMILVRRDPGIADRVGSIVADE